METLDATKSVEDLYRSHYSQLVHVVMRYLDRRDLAEEIVQDAFLKYFANECAPKPGAELAYLRSMVLNMAPSALRRRVVEAKHLERRVLIVASAEAQALQRIRNGQLHQEIRQLPCRQRSVITQQHLFGQPIAAIASTLGISTGSVKQHAFRARAALQDRLEAAGL